VCLAAGFFADTLRVVRWGVAADTATAAEVAAARAEHGLAGRYVLFSGTLEPRKNVPALLAAFASVETGDVDLVIAGPTGWNEDVGPAVAALGSRVHLLGFVPRSQLAALMAGASAVCYPSLREGFGLPVLEAMVQGTPVVTSRGTATEEVGGDAALLVEPRDVASIAEGLDRVLGDSALAADMAARGRARAAAYTWRAAADAYLDVYEEAAG
jgi:glycosyltransferase involved in cell wall biosynthesis